MSADRRPPLGRSSAQHAAAQLGGGDPRRSFSGPRFRFQDLQLTQIRWRGWGGRTASAQNVRYTNNGYAGRNTIRVSRRITCQGRRVYSRLRIVGRGSPGALTITCRQIKRSELRFVKPR